MEEEIRSWLDSTLADSRFQWEYWKAQRLPDLDDWGSLFAAFLQDRTSVSGSGILLTGADNHSKQFAAVQMLGHLIAESYEGVFLDGMELGTSGAIQAKQKLNCLLDHFYDAGMGLCLILEGMESCPCRRELLRFLGQKLCEYRMYQDQLTPLFLILLDDQEQDIPGLLRNCLRLCRVQLPNRERRAAYLAQHAKSLRHYLSLEVFAQSTEGASYKQLQDLVVLTEGYVDSRDGQGMSDEELRTLLAGQMPLPAQEDAMQSICQSVQQLIEQLPQLIKNAGGGTGGGLPGPNSPPVSQPPISDGIPTKADIENMPPLALAVELFGEQAVEEMRKMSERIVN